MKFDPNDVNPEFVARAAEILDGILYEDILKASRAGATFYVFVSTLWEYVCCIGVMLTNVCFLMESERLLLLCIR